MQGLVSLLPPEAKGTAWKLGPQLPVRGGSWVLLMTRDVSTNSASLNIDPQQWGFGSIVTNCAKVHEGAIGGPIDHTNMRFSHSGSKPQYMGTAEIQFRRIYVFILYYTTLYRKTPQKYHNHYIPYYTILGSLCLCGLLGPSFQYLTAQWYC